MKLSHLLGAILVAAVTPLTAQTIDTLGGTTNSPSGASRGKGNLVGVTSTVLLMDHEWFLDIPGTETLTFFAYRLPARSGVANLEWTMNVTVTGGGGGPAWYGTGPIALPLICGNHYLLGVSWSGSITYHYDIVRAAQPISFGTWERANTLTYPIPQTYTVSAGIDVAQYHQRLTSIPLSGGIGCVGTGCNTSGGTLPRLVAGALAIRGATMPLEILDAAPSAPAAYVFAFGQTLANPVPLYGCSAWLDLTGAVSSLIVVTSPAGTVNLQLPVPPNPAISGLQLATQGGVLGTTIDFTNALDFTVN